MIQRRWQAMLDWKTRARLVTWIRSFNPSTAQTISERWSIKYQPKMMSRLKVLHWHCKEFSIICNTKIRQLVRNNGWCWNSVFDGTNETLIYQVLPNWQSPLAGIHWKLSINTMCRNSIVYFRIIWKWKWRFIKKKFECRCDDCGVS